MNFPTSYAAAVAVPLPDDDVIRPVIEDYYGSTYQPDTTLNVVKMFAGTGVAGAKTLTDETLTELLATFGEDSTRKYILSISVFIFMGLWLNGCRVPLETTDKVSKTTTTNPAGLAVKQRGADEV